MLIFILLAAKGGFTAAAVGVVISGYGLVIQDLVDRSEGLEKFKKRLPGSVKVKNSLMRMLIVDTLEFAVMGAFWFLA